MMQTRLNIEIIFYVATEELDKYFGKSIKERYSLSNKKLHKCYLPLNLVSLQYGKFIYRFWQRKVTLSLKLSMALSTNPSSSPSTQIF